MVQFQSTPGGDLYFLVSIDTRHVVMTSLPCQSVTTNKSPPQTYQSSLLNQGMAAANDPSDILSIKVLAAFLASAEFLLTHGHEALPPPCSPLLQWEHE